MLAARRRRIPYILTFHSGGHSSRLRHALRPVQIRLLRPLLRGARRLIAVSEFEARVFRRELRLGPDRVVVIPNGADLPSAPGGAPVERDATLILSVGRLERYKGHDRLVRALPHVRDQVPGVRLLILGEGPYQRQLRSLAVRSGVDDAVAIDSVPREQMHRAVRRAALVALLSEYESQGLGAQEALALGCRIVITDSTALADLREIPQVAAVRPEADDLEIAEVLIAQLRAGPTTGGLPLMLSTWDDCARRLGELYRTVAGASRT
jgi:glycosyltransferase involved in cell wall biosynthesis